MNNAKLDSKIALLAGNGNFPVDFVKNAIKKDIEIVVIKIKGEASLELEKLAKKVYEIKIGEFGKLLKILKKERIKQMAFAGGVKRVNLFGNVKIDAKGLLILAKAKTIRDDVILRAATKEIEVNGIQVLSPTVLLENYVAKRGLISNRDFTESEFEDVRFGWNVAKKIGEFDIGQGVVVADGLVVAVEAVEGTDEMIFRAGKLIQKSAKERKGVLVKLVKPQQDLRLDLPTVGPTTLENMNKARLSALAIEAEKTVIIDPITFEGLANKYKIAVRVFDKEEL
ncbi:MAG: LpxI family protein [Bdellovibrionota bacterium]